MNRKYIDGIRLTEPIEETSYLYELPVVKAMMRTKGFVLSSDVTFFVGENGTGKSTLLEAIAVAYGFNAEGGSRNFHFSTELSHSELFRHITLSKPAHPKDGFFLRAESFYNAASYISELDKIPAARPKLIESYGGKPLHEQSHGESFMAVLLHRFRGGGLYILDEPEAALSPSRLMALLVCIHDLVEKDSQFIIATHSPILMAYPNAEIWGFSEKGLATVDYKKTEHYQLTLRFLENPERMLRQLFDENASDQTPNTEY